MRPESVSKPKTGRLESLTSIRFLGAAYIALGHWMLLVPVISHQSTLWHFVAFARCGVSGFFVLSGFILAWVYLQDSRTLNKRQFYVSRFARIYPLFLLTVLLDCPWYFWSHIAQFGVSGALIKTGISLASCLVMLQAWGRQFWGLNLPSWSLSVETLFYALFPFIGVLLWKVRKQWIWPAMLFVYVGGQILVLLAVKASVSHPFDPSVLLFFPPLHVSTFMLGILLAKLRLSVDDRKPTSDKRAWLSYVLLGMVGFTFVTLALVLPSSVIESRTGQILLQDGAFAPMFCGLIWVLSDRRPSSRILNAPWLILLGEASYGLYLIHDPVSHLVSPGLLYVLRNVSWREFRILYLLSFPVYLALCIALSIASYLWFEGPARRWIRARFGSRSRASETRKFTENPALRKSDFRPSDSASN
jgi:peptidoglycan/LPS O-acetylase OafA/YrhL